VKVFERWSWFSLAVYGQMIDIPAWTFSFLAVGANCSDTITRERVLILSAHKVVAAQVILMVEVNQEVDPCMVV
jgi:hypothetical protein